MFSRFFRQGAWYHLVLSFWLSEWNSERASASPGLEDPSPPTCSIPILNEDTSGFRRELTPVARGSVAFSCQDPDSETGQPTLCEGLLGAGAAATAWEETLDWHQVVLELRLAACQIVSCLTDEETGLTWHIWSAPQRTFNNPRTPRSHRTLPTGARKKRAGTLLEKVSHSYP